MEAESSGDSADSPTHEKYLKAFAVAKMKPEMKGKLKAIPLQRWKQAVLRLRLFSSFNLVSKWSVGWLQQDAEDEINLEMEAIDISNVDQVANRIMWKMEEMARAYTHFHSEFQKSKQIPRDVEEILERFLNVMAFQDIPPVFQDQFVDPGVRRLIMLDKILRQRSGGQFQYIQTLNLVKEHYAKSIAQAAESVQAQRKTDNALANMKLQEELEDIQLMQEDGLRNLEKLQKLAKELEEKIQVTGNQLSDVDQTIERTTSTASEELTKQKELLERFLKEKAAIEQKIQEQLRQKAWAMFKYGLSRSELTLEKCASINQLIAGYKKSVHLKEKIDFILEHLNLDEFSKDEQNNRHLTDFVQSINTDDLNQCTVDLDKIFNQAFPEKRFKLEGTKSKVIAKGRILVMSEVLTSLKLSTKVSDIQIYAGHSILIDKDFIVPGANITICSPKIIVLGSSVSIDTSGRNARQITETKAPDGLYEGRYGEDGEDGDDGESAGHVLITTEELIGEDKLHIKAVGGSGSNGQSGGDGHAGKKGVVGKNAKKPGERCQISYGELEMERGTNGTDGKPGGKGGDCGSGGKGGAEGSIRVHKAGIQLSNRRFKAKRGIPGKPGNPGKGGEGGKAGKDGYDHARHRYTNVFLQFTSWEESKGDLEAKYESGWYGFKRGWNVTIRRPPEDLWKAKGQYEARGRKATFRNDEEDTAISSEPIELQSIFEEYLATMTEYGNTFKKKEESTSATDSLIQQSNALLANKNGLIQNTKAEMAKAEGRNNAALTALQATKARLLNVQSNLSDSKYKTKDGISKQHRNLNELAQQKREKTTELNAVMAEGNEIIEDQRKLKVVIESYEEKIAMQLLTQRTAEATRVSRLSQFDECDVKTKKEEAAAPTTSQIDELILETIQDQDLTSAHTPLLQTTFSDIYNKFNDELVCQMSSELSHLGKAVEEFLQVWQSASVNVKTQQQPAVIEDLLTTLLRFSGKTSEKIYILRNMVHADLELTMTLQNDTITRNLSKIFNLAPSNSNPSLISLIILVRLTDLSQFIKNSQDFNDKFDAIIKLENESKKDSPDKEVCNLFLHILENRYIHHRAKSLSSNEESSLAMGTELTTFWYQFQEILTKIDVNYSKLPTVFDRFEQMAFKDVGAFIISELTLSKELFTFLKSLISTENWFKRFKKMVSRSYRDKQIMDPTNILLNIFDMAVRIETELPLNPNQLWELETTIYANDKLETGEQTNISQAIYSYYKTFHQNQIIANILNSAILADKTFIKQIETCLESSFSILSYEARISYYNQIKSLFIKELVGNGVETKDNSTNVKLKLESHENELEAILKDVMAELCLPKSIEVKEFLSNNKHKSWTKDRIKALQICFQIHHADAMQVDALKDILSAFIPIEGKIRSDQKSSTTDRSLHCFRLVEETIRTKAFIMLRTRLDALVPNVTGGDVAAASITDLS